MNSQSGNEGPSDLQKGKDVQRESARPMTNNETGALDKAPRNTAKCKAQGPPSLIDYDKMTKEQKIGAERLWSSYLVAEDAPGPMLTNSNSEGPTG